MIIYKYSKKQNNFLKRKEIKIEIIKSPIYVKLTEEERKTLRDAYDILNELYDIIADNDCEYVDDTFGNDYDRLNVALTANVLQMLAPAEKVEIRN